MIYRFGDHVLDAMNYELLCAGEPVGVEPQVFSVLVHLIENRDRVVSRDELIEVVWQQRIVSDATISSRVNAARRAVGDNGEDQAVIKTVPRRGFKFVASVSPAEVDAIPIASNDDMVNISGVGRFDKPSIAVLPFNNMSADPEQEYFADGMADDIITELSRMPWFSVIARNSSFAYKNQAFDIKQVGRELGVSYVLEGSVRRAGNRLRINAQLVDTMTGSHIWAERYDREIADIFDIQDEITEAIIAAVAPEFVSAELRKSRQKNASELSAWECVMRGRAHAWKLSRDDASLARELFEKALSLSPDRGLGASDLALVHFLDAFYAWGESPEESLKTMVETAEKAVALDENDPLALTILAWAYNFARKWDDALATVERAVAISPSFAPAIGIHGAILACNDQPDLAIRTVDEAVRLSPRDGFMPFWLMGLYWAHHSQRDYEQAEAVAMRAARAAPNNPTFRRQLAVAYHMLGRDEEAKEALEQYLALASDKTITTVRNIPSRNPYDLGRFVDALLEIGLTE
jgi:TolB-like protein